MDMYQNSLFFTLLLIKCYF